MSVRLCPQCRRAMTPNVCDRKGAIAEMALNLACCARDITDIIEAHYVTGQVFDEQRLREALDLAVPSAFGLCVLLHMEDESAQQPHEPALKQLKLDL